MPKIIIGDNVGIGGNCQIWTHVGDFSERQHDKNDYKEKILPVNIRNGAVCYSGVILNPGIIVGKRSRVYALGMVTKNIPDNEIWGGIPAKKIMNRQGKMNMKIKTSYKNK